MPRPASSFRAARGRRSGLDLVPSWGTGPEGEIDNGQPDDGLVRLLPAMRSSPNMGFVAP